MRTSHRWAIVSQRFLSCAILLLTLGSRSLAEDPQKAPDVQSLRVAAQDGTELATDVYLPAGEGPFPTILIRTPYNKDGMKAVAALFVTQGYAVVAQDMRGRFASAGHHAIIFGN